jgi:hypothetical protein
MILRISKDAQGEKRCINVVEIARRQRPVNATALARPNAPRRMALAWSFAVTRALLYNP